MSKVSMPIVVSIPYNSDAGVRASLEGLERPLSDRDRFLLLEYPTVYIIYSSEENGSNRYKKEVYVYVGETNNIEVRTRQHRIDDTKSSNKKAWIAYRNNPHTRMYVIGHRHFNKSLTLDIENRLMGYVLASESDAKLGVTNGRGNPQNDYYTRDEFEEIASKTWRKLHSFDEKLFPAERVIKSSAIFKASPFHKLSDEQYRAEDIILQQLARVRKATSARKQLIFVEGSAGTGKTVLLSHLFLEIVKQISNEGQLVKDDAGQLISQSDASRMAIVVNHDEQKTVYDAIAKRLGLQQHSGEIVFKSTPFINQYSEYRDEYALIGGLEHQNHPSEELDVVLVDEAHLLFNTGNQGYVGHRNQLWDIVDRARVTIAIFDPEQVLRSSQEVPADVKAALFAEDRYDDSLGGDVGMRESIPIFDTHIDITNVLLRQQFRIDACDEIIDWIDRFASKGEIGPIPTDTKKRSKPDETPYEIKIFDSPTELFEAIKEKATDESAGLSRLLATYDWPYTKGKHPNKNPDEYWAVSLVRREGAWIYSDDFASSEDIVQAGSNPSRFALPWNYQLKATGPRNLRDKDAAWAEKPHTLNEVGSIYTIQGFDLNYAGIIIGPSVQWRDGSVVFDASFSKNYQAKNGSNQPEENLRHELNVLLKRGVHGLYLFAVDFELQEHLLKMSVIE